MTDDTVQLVAAVRDMTAAFEAMRSASQSLAETHAADMVLRRKVRVWAVGVAAGLAVGVIILVAVASHSLRTANAVAAEARSHETQECDAARNLRADLHRGVAAVLDEITVQSTDPDTPGQLAAAMEALREEVPIGPPC